MFLAQILGPNLDIQIDLPYPPAKGDDFSILGKSYVVVRRHWIMYQDLSLILTVEEKD